MSYLQGVPLVQEAELQDWLLGIANGKPVESGGFLKALAEVALRADGENYQILRPALLEIKAKYPKYTFAGLLRE